MKTSLWFKSFTLLASLVLLVSCGDKTPEIPENDPGFSSYISAHTAGVISAQAPIEFILQNAVNPGVEEGTPVDADVFEFDPSLAGRTVWKNENTIVFYPEEPLESGASYEGTFHLGLLMPVPSELKHFEFLVQAVHQDYTLLEYSLNPHTTNGMRLNQLKGTFRSADVSTVEEASENLKFYGLDGQSVSWSTTEREQHFEFTIDSVERKEEGYQLSVEYDDEEVATMNIPSLSEFGILDVFVEQAPVQLIRVSFTDPLLANQDLRGLFRIENINVSSVSIKGSVATLYPSTAYNGDVTLTISEGVRNVLGYSLKSEYTQSVSFQAARPEVRFTGEGNIVPTSGNVSVPFQAIGLKAVDVRVYQVYSDNVHQFLQENTLNGNQNLKRVARPIYEGRVDIKGTGVSHSVWNTYSLDLDKLVKRDPGAIYRIEIGFRKSYSYYPCSDATTLIGGDEAPYEVDADDFDSYYREYFYIDDYDYRERDNPCHVSYYNYSRIIRKNVLATDLGLIVKGNDGHYSVYVSSLISTDAVSGAEVTFYNYQGREITSGTTNGDGALYIDLEAVPYRVQAKANGQFAYVTLEPSRSLSVSNFDVSGVEFSTGLSAFLYAERGVWRPGDTIFLNAVLNDASNPLPSNHPIVLTVDDPQGKEVFRKVVPRGANSIFDFTFKTTKEAITGNYRAVLKVGGKTFTKSLSVETVQPNRLDISVEAEDDVITTDGSSDLSVHVEWLTGAKAPNLNVDMQGRLSINTKPFKGYEDYNWYEITKSAPNLQSSTIYEGNLDANGDASVHPQLGNLSYSPGMLNLYIGTKAFEPGGRFSVNGTSVKVAPFNSFVGFKMPELNRYGYLETEKDHRLTLATLDAYGKPVSSHVSVKIYKVSWSWWWSARRGNTTYLSNSSKHLIGTYSTNTTDGKGHLDFSISDDYWGRVLIVVEDENSGHSSSALGYLDWGWGRDRSGRQGSEAANIINVQTDKEKYNVGEEAKITVPSTGGGRLLVSIEDGTTQLLDDFVETEDGMTEYTLKITEEMAPNVYANLMILQPHSQSENDLPIRLFGIAPILVENPATHLEPVIGVPEKIRPQSELNVEVSEKNGQQMEYTLAVVDEGLLQLTNFQTPDPWIVFYAKRALGVRTWDLYDYVMNAFGGEIAQVLAVGGDGKLNPDNEESAERFVPVVRHLGPFTLKAGEKASHQIDIPNYIGKVRVMVVAANKEEAYGSAEENVRVVQPLMTQLTMPRVLGPGERILVPVTIFAMEDDIDEVNVKLKTTGPLKLERTSSVVEFNEAGQKTIYFAGNVDDELGIATIELEAKGGREVSTDRVEISVRSPLTSRTNEDIIDIPSKRMQQFAAAPFGVGGSNKLTVEVSSVPSLNLGMRLHYLIGYPHGCLEQTTSRVFAMLNLDAWVDLTAEQKSNIDEYVRAGIDKLRGMQMSGGGFRYWPSSNGASAWGSTYAGHFIIAAEKKGYPLPSGMKESYIRYATNQAKMWNQTNYYSYNNDLNQAYRLYVLALAGEPEIGSMNRLRSKSNLTNQAADRLALAFAMINEEDIAREVMAKTWTKPNDDYYYYSWGSHARDLAMSLELFTRLGEEGESIRLARELAEELAHGYMSTQSLGFGLFALSEAFEGSNNSLSAEVTIGGEKHTINTDHVVTRIEVEDFESAKDITVRNNGDGPIYARILRTGVPHYGEELPFADRITMNVSYVNPTTGQPLDVSVLEVGTSIRAVVTLNRSYSSRDYLDLALTQIFPSGWEISNSRMMETSGTGGENLDYQDIRDDRVLTYFSMYGYSRETITITVDLTATYPGKWYLPPTTVEAMYNDVVKAGNAGKWVAVVSQ